MTRAFIEREISKIKKSLVSKYRPTKIILIGSAAWGKFNRYSDLDFLVIKENVPHFGRDRMKQAQKCINSVLPVDILIYKPSEFNERFKLGDPFIKLVVSKGRVIYD